MANTHDTKKRLLTFINPFILIAIGIVVVMSYTVWQVALLSGIVTTAFSHWFVGILIFFPLLLLSTMISASIRYRKVVSVLYTVSVIWFPALIYLFIGAVVIAIVSLISTHFNVMVDLAILAWSIVGIIIAALVGGIMNAQYIRITKYDIESPELSKTWSGKRIAVFSDVHLGIVRSGHFMKKVVDIVNSINPDIAIIAGDVIDGPIFDYVKGLSPLKEIKTRQGLIYAQGNHEGYNSEPEKFYPVIESLTTTLINKTIMVDGVQIIGLGFARETLEETKEKLALAGYDPNLPSLVIMHDPTNSRALQDEQVSLILSGHTHMGQFFPFNLMMRPIYKEFAYGKNVKGKTTSITTSGVGTMMPPLRLCSIPEIVVLTFK